LIWTCPDCGGHAVGLAILRKVVERNQINQFWQKTRNAAQAGTRPCPSCRKLMLEVPLGETPELFKLDVCRACQFVWFDPKELEALPVAPAVAEEDKSDALPQEAREAVAILEANRIGEQARGSGFAAEAPAEWWKYLPALLGFPAEYDNPVKHFPWATVALAILIIAASVSAFSNLKEAVAQFGFIPAQFWRLGGLTLLTSFFLHGSILHLAGNMYFLLVFGDNVEDVLGKGRYLLLVFAATGAGGLLHTLLAPDSQLPCIGASGGISALIVFYALQFPRARLGWIVAYVRGSWIQVPAWFALVVWIIYQFVMLFLQRKGLTDMSAMAHLGGAAIGFLYWLKVRPKPQMEESALIP